MKEEKKIQITPNTPYFSHQCKTWDEGTEKWEEEGVKTVKTETKTSGSGDSSSFTTCNVTVARYVTLVESPQPPGKIIVHCSKDN